ncbi:hypothetical protein WG66_002499 [Moniliophthora roreri]|nr:hypothetical protein WG66_002499 [Moniliophthora roreri]
MPSLSLSRSLHIELKIAFRGIHCSELLVESNQEQWGSSGAVGQNSTLQSKSYNVDLLMDLLILGDRDQHTLLPPPLDQYIIRVGIMLQLCALRCDGFGVDTREGNRWPRNKVSPGAAGSLHQSPVFVPLRCSL